MDRRHASQPPARDWFLSRAHVLVRLMCLVCLAIVAFAAIGCKKHKSEALKVDEPTVAEKFGLTEAQANEALATVGDKVITVGEFAERVNEQSPYLRARFDNPQYRREFLNDLIRFELLVREAKARGLDTHPRVVAERRTLIGDAYLRKYINNNVDPNAITDKDLHDYYAAHSDLFDRTEMRRASVIVLKDEAAARLVVEKAFRANGDLEFHKLASEYSIDPVAKSDGGDLLFFDKDDAHIPAPIRDAVFSLPDPGAVFPRVVHTPKGFVVVRYRSRRPAIHTSFEDARRSVHLGVLDDRRTAAREKLLAELRTKYPVTINEPVVKDLSAAAQAGQLDFHGRRSYPALPKQ